MLQKINNKKHVLIIDDDLSVSKMLAMLLETRGYNVNMVHSGEDALHCVGSDAVDLILLDLVLPDLQGFEVCRKLKENQHTRHIPIIMLSAKLLPEDIIEGLYLGADDYLRKPFEYEELIARMEAVLRRGSIYRYGNLVSQGEEAIICELRKIIEQELIVPYFQPIYWIKSGQLLGLEVLTRPQTQTMLANPEQLFKAAIQFGVYHDLEVLCWKTAIAQVAQYLTSEKLFLNCNPYLVEGPKFLTIKSLFDQSNINPANVVLEITERSAIGDFKTFYEHLRRYRDYGFKFAIDDVGGGYASLESIVETRPEVVKIDRHIVCDLDGNQFKRSIVKFVVAFCQEHNIITVAEGIENKQDLAIVKELGVDAAQGYYLCRPTPEVNLAKMRSSPV